MPQSRGRVPRNKSQATRRREQRRCAERASPPVRLGDGARVVARRGVEAEARGDAEAALELHFAGPHVEGSIREARLRELVALGAEAPPWMLSRWLLGQVSRWFLVEDREEIRHGLVIAAETAYFGIDLERPMGQDPQAFAIGLAVSDWVATQLAIYEYDGLRRFLRTVADPRFVSRTDRIEEWADARMGGYRFDDVIDDRVLLTDLATGRPTEVLNIGSAWAREAGSTVIGRVVPIAAGPGSMFESRPLAVDSITADEVADTARPGTAGWTGALTRARKEDRLPLGFSKLEPTSYLTDLPGGGFTGLEVDDITDSGPEASVALADLVLDQVSLEPAVAPHVAVPLAHLLLDADLRAAVAEHCTQSSQRAAWVAISRVLPEPVRRHASAMAEAAEGDGATHR